MHCAQSNEFVGAYGAHSIIHPIGYGTVLKTLRRTSGKLCVHSAAEQFQIHSIAAEFESGVLCIPKPYELIHNAAYTMEFILPGGVYLPPNRYKHFPPLIREFNKFFGHMYKAGYFPYKFSIIAYPENKFALFDFGNFGSVQNGIIKLRGLDFLMDLMEAEHRFGILSFLLDEETYLESEEKIELLSIDL
jgi:hypothetical protein